METKKYDARTDNYIEARLRRYPSVKTKQDKKQKPLDKSKKV